MNKIKVLEIVGNACRGGLESYVLTYAKTLDDEFEVSYLFYDDSESIPFEEISALNGKVLKVPNIKHIFKFKKKIQEIYKENNFDIVHSHINTLSVFPLKYAKKCGVKVRISQSHTTSNKHELVRHLIKSILRLFSKKYATHYVAVSENAANFQFGKKHLNEVNLLPGSIDVSRYKFDEKNREKIREQIGFQKTDYVVGLFGRFCKTKNHDFVLKLASRLPDQRFLLVGSGNKNKLINVLSKKNLKNVTILDSKQNIGEYYSAIDCFILPSLYEGFGLVALEAIANGLYCVASINVPLKSFGFKNIQFLPLDVDLWVNTLKSYPQRYNEVSSLEKFDSKSSSFEGFKTFYLSLIL